MIFLLPKNKTNQAKELLIYQKEDWKESSISEICAPVKPGRVKDGAPRMEFKMPPDLFPPSRSPYLPLPPQLDGDFH